MTSKLIKENLSGFFPWDLPVVKISPEWVTGPELGKSSGRIATFSLWTDWTDYKTNTQITKELKITPILDKLLEYERNWIQHLNRIPCNRLPRVMKHYSPTGRRNQGRTLKRLLDTWDRNVSTSGPTPWHIYVVVDDDDDERTTYRMNEPFKLQLLQFSIQFNSNKTLSVISFQYPSMHYKSRGFYRA